MAKNLSETLEGLKAMEVAERKAAIQDYFKIIRRNTNPKEGDVERLQDCLKRLGLSINHVAFHCELLKEADRLKANAALIGEFERTKNEILKEAQALDDQMKVLTEQFNVVNQKYKENENGTSQARQDSMTFDLLVSLFPQLLTDDQAACGKKITIDGEPYVVRKAREMAGITFHEMFPTAS